MADRRRRLASLGLTLVLVAANLVAANWILAGWPGARVDLTEDRLYSISPATRSLLDELEENVTIHGYFSERTHPKLAPLVPRIADLVEEYRAVSGGRVEVEWIDPGTDEALEEEAVERFGVQSTPFRLATKYESAIVNAYFALVVRYGDQYVRYGFEDLIQVDPTPDGDVDVRLRNLEYDLTRAIKKVVYGFRSTHELFERLERPVRLLAVWTPGTLPELLADVPEAVRTAAAELEETGGERFAFEEVDPSADPSVRERLAERYGLQPIQFGMLAEDSFYLYALLEIGERVEPLYLLDESVTSAAVREAVESALRRHTPGFLTTVGIAVPDEPELPPELRMQLGMPPSPPPEFQQVRQLLEQDYRTVSVALDDPAGIPTEVDVLLVLEPQRLGERAVWNVDRYLMRGGRIVLCAGSHDVDFGMQGLSLVPVDTGLEGWLAAYGVEIEDALVLDDRNQPLPVPQVRQTPIGPIRTWELAPYPYLVEVREEGLVHAEVAARLDAVGIYWGSPITIDAKAAGELEVLPLLRSSDRSWATPDTTIGFDYEVPPDAAPQLLAVALAGRFPSYFAGREPPAEIAAGELPARSPASSPPTRLVVIGNAQFLSDFVAQALGRIEGGFFTENLRFVQNVIDWVHLDEEMLDIRSRGATMRRLATVDAARQVTIETLSYALPLAALAVVALVVRWRRVRAVPLAGDAAP